MVQKQRQPRKTNERQGETSRPAVGGSRFGILAPVDEDNTEINDDNQVIREGMVILETCNRRRNQNWRERAHMENNGKVDCTLTNVRIAEGTTLVEQRAQKDMVQQVNVYRRVEKRTRDITDGLMRKGKNVLMLTMEGAQERDLNEGTNCENGRETSYCRTPQEREQLVNEPPSSPFDPGEQRVIETLDYQVNGP